MVLTWPRLLGLSIAEVAHAADLPLSKLEGEVVLTYDETLQLWTGLDRLTEDPIIDASEIEERPELGDRLDDALDDFAGLPPPPAPSGLIATLRECALERGRPLRELAARPRLVRGADGLGLLLAAHGTPLARDRPFASAVSDAFALAVDHLAALDAFDS